MVTSGKIVASFPLIQPRTSFTLKVAHHFSQCHLQSGRQWKSNLLIIINRSFRDGSFNCDFEDYFFGFLSAYPEQIKDVEHLNTYIPAQSLGKS